MGRTIEKPDIFMRKAPDFEQRLKYLINYLELEIVALATIFSDEDKNYYYMIADADNTDIFVWLTYREAEKIDTRFTTAILDHADEIMDDMLHVHMYSASSMVILDEPMFKLNEKSDE